MKKNTIKSIVFALSLGLACNAYALNLDKVKGNFLKGDYKSAIREGEKIMAGAGHLPDSDELYYILGLCYLKDGNLLRASDIFEIIIKEFKASRFREEARVCLGDVFYLKRDYDKAQSYYQGLLKDDPKTKFEPMIYYRLSQIGFKKGDTAQGNQYLDRLKQLYPLNLESKLGQESCDLPVSSAFNYSVQVGSFSSASNANNLCRKLSGSGYTAYVQEAVSEGKATYRVRVGKLDSRAQALELRNRLSSEGYPTKICP